MAKPADGYLFHEEQYEGPDTPFKPGIQEFDTMTCGHCGNIVILNPVRVRERGRCFLGDHYLCDVCNGVYSRTGECFSVARSVALMIAHPGSDFGIGSVLPTEQQRKLSEAAKPYPGIWLPGKD